MRKIKQKQHMSQIFHRQPIIMSNNSNVDNKQACTTRHRNDHSIEAKSPLKIPNVATFFDNRSGGICNPDASGTTNHKNFNINQNHNDKSDLTFRFKTQPQPSSNELNFETNSKLNNKDFINRNIFIYQAQNKQNKPKNNQYQKQSHQWSLKQTKQSQKGSQNNNSSTVKVVSKQNMRINIKLLTQSYNCQSLPQQMCNFEVTPSQRAPISPQQCSIINNMWQLCTFLSTFRNPNIKQSVQNIQLEIKKMLTLIAEQNFYEQPLVSSKKIKLQNCIAYSQCQKEVYHKQIGSDSEDSLHKSDINRFFIDKQADQYSQPNQDNNQLESFLQHIQDDGEELNLEKKNINGCNYNFITKNDSSDDLQVKKIMYMLQQKNNLNNQKQSVQSSKQQINKISLQISPRASFQTNCSNFKNINKQANKKDMKNDIRSQRLSELSSFNQVSCDQSGLTLFEIERSTQRINQSNLRFICNQMVNSDVSGQVKSLSVKSNSNRDSQPNNNMAESQRCKQKTLIAKQGSRFRRTRAQTRNLTQADKQDNKKTVSKQQSNEVSLQQQQEQQSSNFMDSSSYNHFNCNQDNRKIESAYCELGNKRKVLNDIVAMLNHKYNKNIRLQ